MTIAVSAHRGGGEVAPRGSWGAYEHAMSVGADYLEFDVRRTGDGEFVVYHDERVSRGGPLLRELTWRELSDLAGHDVPRVGDLMVKMAGRAQGHVDLKERGYEREVVGLAVDLLGHRNFVVTAGDAAVAACRAAFPDERAALSLGRTLWEIPIARYFQTRYSELFPLRRMAGCGADSVAVHQRYAALRTLACCARHDIDCMVWTVNGSSRIRHFLRDPRVAILITDRPAYALSRRAQLAK